MSTAPAWVSYAALLLSTGSVIVAGLSFRAGGPRLRIQSQRLRREAPDNPFPNGAPVRLTVVNSGRAAITVEGFHVTYPSGREPLARVKSAEGAPLPHRLDAHASESWVVDALPLARAVDSKTKGRDDPLIGPVQFRFVATAGNGKAAREKHLSYPAVRFIADAQRDP